MKAKKGRRAIAQGVIIFGAIVLALTMVLPVLAEGPGGHEGKSDNSNSNGQSEGKGNSGDENPGQAGQANDCKPVEILPENSQGNPGEPSHNRQLPAGKPDQPGQGKARPDQADSQGNKGPARLRQANSQGKWDQARLRQAGSHGKKGKAKLDTASSHPNLSQAQSWVRSEPGVDPGRPELANNQMGNSGLQADQASGPGAAFTSSNGTYDLCRSTGKPESKAYLFSEISPDGRSVRISNTRGLKNLRITVNGQRFQVNLEDQATSTMVDVNVSSALLASNTNSIVLFTALGKPGTCAMVVLR